MQSINALDFQDSEVSSAELQDEQFIVRFSAAHIHRVDSKDSGSGFLQSLELMIDQPTVLEKDSGCVGRISQGTLRVAGVTARLVPVPYDVEVDVEIELAFANGSRCKVAGRRITIAPAGEVRMMEWLKC